MEAGSGLAATSDKMRKLDRLNRLMAHRPWAVGEAAFAELGENAEGTTSMARRWSNSEMAHATVLLAHFHSLAAFALGCGGLQAVREGRGGPAAVPEAGAGGAAVDGGKISTDDENR